MPAREALIVASARYSDPVLQQLQAPAGDAHHLSAVLSKPDIGNFQVKELIDQPSYEVSAAIEEFFANRQPDDLVLLYFSGHGIKDEDGRLFFATSNTKRSRLLSTAVPASMVNAAMLRSRSRRQLLILDCCYSGAFARGMFAKSDARVDTIDHFQGTGRIVLTASDATQYAMEEERVTGEGMRSIFTEIIVEGLRTGAADINFDGMISLDELYDYTLDRVSARNPAQKPMKWVLGATGEIIIARNPQPPPPADLPSKLLNALDDSNSLGVRQGAVKDVGKILFGKNRAMALAADLKLNELLNDDRRSISDLARDLLDEKARLEQEEQARLAAEKARIEQEEQARLAAEKARREQEEQARQAAEKARRQQEEQARLAAEKARIEQEKQVRLAAEKARREQEEQARVAAERARIEQEKQVRLAAEKARREQEEQARLAVEKARIEQERQVRLAAEEARREQEEQARLAVEKARREQQEQARLAAERARREQEEQARQAAEKARREQQEQARLAAEKARREQEEQARQAAEKACREQQEGARQAAEKAGHKQEDQVTLLPSAALRPPIRMLLAALLIALLIGVVYLFWPLPRAGLYLRVDGEKDECIDRRVVGGKGTGEWNLTTVEHGCLNKKLKKGADLTPADVSTDCPVACTTSK